MDGMIPWVEPNLWGRESDYVLDALRSTWISGGPYVERLEADLRKYCGVPHALAVANGTAAVHLAYLALDIQPGDEIVVPGFGFQAAANIALHMHARPVFAEVDADTWNVTAERIEACLTPRTKAIVVVHTYGNVAPMDSIMALAERRGVPVIEDAAEAFASAYRGRLAGTWGHLGCFSFQATKTITTGEGGMVLTRDAALADRMCMFRSHGMLRKRYWHDVPGHNFRLTNLQAALGCAQFEALDRIVSARERVHRRYRAALEGQTGISLQRFPEGVQPVLWAMACRLAPDAFPQGRDAVMDQLKAKGIECRPGFYPASVQDIYDCPPLPISEAVSREMISLPTFTALADEKIEYVCRQLLAQRSRVRSDAA